MSNELQLRRVTLSITIIICLMSLVPLISSLKSKKEIQSLLQKDKAYRESLVILKEHLNRLELAEKEFFLKKDKIYFHSLKLVKIDVLNDISAIRKYPGHKEIKLNVIRHFKTLDQLSQIIQKEGREDTGLIGEARKIVHQIERYLKKSKTFKYRNYISYLLIRRYEKDFLLRDKLVYYQRLVEEISKNEKRLPKKYYDKYRLYIEKINQIQLVRSRAKTLFDNLNWSLNEIQLSILRMDTKLQQELLDQSSSIEQRQQRVAIMLLVFSLAISGSAVVLLRVFRGHSQQMHKLNNELSKKVVEIESMQKKLVSQQKLASLGNLATGIAHEIKNPLNIIIASMDNLRDLLIDKVLPRFDKSKDLESIEDLSFLMKAIEDGAQRSDVIIKGMLDLTSNIDTERSVIEVGELIDECLNGLSEKTSYRLEVKSELVSNWKLIGCKSQLKKGLLSILDNSLYFMGERAKKEVGFAGELKISLIDEAGKHKIIIEDNGIGIDKEILDRSRHLEPFYSSKPTGEGVGLGLSITNDIMIQHGGTMTYDSLDPGCRVTITFKNLRGLA